MPGTAQRQGLAPRACDGRGAPNPLTPRALCQWHHWTSSDEGLRLITFFHSRVRRPGRAGNGRHMRSCETALRRHKVPSRLCWPWLALVGRCWASLPHGGEEPFLVLTLISVDSPLVRPEPWVLSQPLTVSTVSLHPRHSPPRRPPHRTRNSPVPTSRFSTSPITSGPRMRAREPRLVLTMIPAAPPRSGLAPLRVGPKVEHPRRHGCDELGTRVSPTQIFNAPSRSPSIVRTRVRKCLNLECRAAFACPARPRFSFDAAPSSRTCPP